MRVVLCHGCFDILHIGHVQHLHQARSFGDFLVVSVTADRFVNKGPNHPVNRLKDRMSVLWAVRWVDRVIASDSESAVMNILKLRPTVFCKGADYDESTLDAQEVEACRAVGAQLRFTTTPKTSIMEILKKCA